MDKISCLMVTLDRPEHVARAIACYVAQTYEERELVIVTDGTADYQDQLRTLGADVPGFRLVPLTGPLPLGTLRNASVEAARGTVVCQWDDDDLYHPERLVVQKRVLDDEQAGACFLGDQLHLFWEERLAYWDNWWLVPGTLMARRDYLPAYDPTLRRHEDTAVQRALIEAGTPVARIGDAGWLYIYVYHGRNTFDRAHHDNIRVLMARSTEQLRDDAPAIRRALDAYPCLPPTISLRGRSGQEAFVWEGTDVRDDYA